MEIENVGEATLTEIELVSNTLGLRTRDFSVRDGSLEQLEPGEIVRAVIELDIDDGRVRRRSALGGLRLDVTVTATPVDDLERTLARERVVLLVADDEEPLPGFADSFGRGVDVLALIGSVVLVAVGGLLPFVPIVVIGILAVRFVRRRRPTAPTIEE